MPTQLELIKQALAQAEADAASMSTLKNENGVLRGKVDTLTAENESLRKQLETLKPKPADPLAGYTKVGNENGTFDTQGKAYDFAYGAEGKITYKTGLVGVIKLNNTTFGDPAPGMGKAAYAKLSSNQPAPTPTPQPPVTDPTPVVARRRGGISDRGTVDQVSSFLKELGLNSVRLWGGLWDNGDIHESEFTTANSYIAKGISTRIVLSPPENPTARAPYPRLALDKMKRVYNRAGGIRLLNEPNQSRYWWRGDWMDAFKWADEVAAEIRTFGNPVGTPSFTGWEDEWEDRIIKIIAANLHKNFDVFAYHNYPVHNPTTDPTGFLARFDKTNQIARRIADRLSQSLGREITTDCDEWGLNKYVTTTATIKLLPGLVESLDAGADDWAYFILARKGTAQKPEDPHDYFPWLIDFVTGERREDLIQAFKAITSKK